VESTWSSCLPLGKTVIQAIAVECIREPIAVEAEP
jgi:hypothetical protein